MLRDKFPDGFDTEVKFVINGKGSILLGPSGVRIGNSEAKCTLAADAETFEQILSGSLDATMAYMSGRLRVFGELGVAMRLGQRIR